MHAMPELTLLTAEDEYDILYHQYGPAKVIHVDVHAWSPAVAKKFLRDVAELFAALGEPVLTIHYLDEQPPDIKQLKFTRLAGFVPIREGKYLDRPVIWLVKAR